MSLLRCWESVAVEYSQSQIYGAGSMPPEACTYHIHVECFVPVRVERLLDGSGGLSLLPIDGDYRERVRQGELGKRHRGILSVLMILANNVYARARA